MTKLFWKIILLRVQFAAACVATYTYDFPAYNVPTTIEPTTTTTTTTTKPLTCPTGWTIFGANCFIVPAGTAAGLAAESTCVALEGHLASIHSAAENNFVVGLLPTGTTAWFGAYRTCATALDDSCFAFRDMTTFGPYTSWDVTEPGNQSGNENCVFISTQTGHEGLWQDDICSRLKILVCEMPAT